MAALEVQLTARGAVGSALEGYAEEKVRAAAKHAPRPVLFARVALTAIDNPSVERPAVAKASLDVSGRQVRAHVAAPTMREAIDELETRLRRRLQVLSGHNEQRRQETGTLGARNLAPRRPPSVTDPRTSRGPSRSASSCGARATRCKLSTREARPSSWSSSTSTSISSRTWTPGRTRSSSGPGTARSRSFDTGPTERVEAATEQLDLMDEPFVFFVDAESGRGNVVYRRYDGHYGLITAG